ncbi:MAG TPA: hypothetical protein VJ044_03940 [Candidatus Hodarchaeales archaeon]|nr:hypothetical protein [Candidatus Hodarchaeales archaeon]
MPSRRSRYQWVYSPTKISSSNVPEDLKQEALAKGQKLIEAILRPRYVLPPPANPKFNYIVEVYCRWRGHYFYFCSKYYCPGPTRISETFESKDVRLEYKGHRKFGLAYFRRGTHWWELFPEVSLDECLKEIESGCFF